MQLAEGNFLIPNGTFFIVVIIFLIVLAVIWFYVVPPIVKVLDDRDRMIHQTTDDNRSAAKGLDEAEAEYLAGLKSARTEAAEIRDAARAAGRSVVDDEKARAAAETAARVEQRTDALRTEGEAAAATARGDLGELSLSLAGRVLGFDVTKDPKLVAEVDRLSKTVVAK
jgi:F-type H+-transporting ATPase subunit b